MTYTLPQRISRAAELHARGYNCAQCVALAFDDMTGNGESSAVVNALAGFGLGCGDMSQICGAVSGANAVRGIVRYTGPADKQAIYAMSRSFMSRYKADNGGLLCRELKGISKPCSELITDAVTLLHNELADE